jgi:hypothetical protein
MVYVLEHGIYVCLYLLDKNLMTIDVCLSLCLFVSVLGVHIWMLLVVADAKCNI